MEKNKNPGRERRKNAHIEPTVKRS